MNALHEKPVYKTLNRKVSAQGTKASVQVWPLDVAVTFS